MLAKWMKRVLVVSSMTALCLTLTVPAAETEAPAPETESEQLSGFHYVNDPRDNPSAMKDIVVNQEAIYGFSPDPESARLGEYATALDWTNPDEVAALKEQREAYLESYSELYSMIEDMLGEAKPLEEIARAVSRRRNELRLEAYADDPEGLAAVKRSNLKTYGHEDGPQADELYEKYGSWQTVLEKALSSNPGMDACLGLYDEYYYTYDVEQEALTETEAQTTEAETGTQTEAETE